MKIVTLVNNSMAYDIRVRRHGQALAEAGHEVVSIGVLTNLDREAPRLPEGTGVRYDWADRRPRATPRSRAGWFVSALAQRLGAKAWKAGLRAGPVAFRIIAPSYDLLVRAGRRHRADVYYANDANTLPVALTLARRAGAKLIYDAHEFYLGECDEMDPAHVEAIRYVEGRGLASADARITVSPLIGQELVSIYKCEAPAVVRNLPDVIPDVEVGDVPEPGQPIRVLYHTANLSLHGRHVKDLIDAVAQVGGGVVLSLRGNVTAEAGPELTAYLERTLAPGTWRVSPALPYAELMREASRNDIGVVLNSTTNRNEILTLPNKIFEYMMVGLAVVAYRTPLAAELIERERIGYVTEENTPGEIAEGLRRLIADRAELGRMKQRARARALETYNWSKEKERLLAVVRGLEAPARPDRSAPASLGAVAAGAPSHADEGLA